MRAMKMEILRKLRLNHERDCTDPAIWYALADAYQAIQALANADLCRRRAEHYKAYYEKGIDKNE